MWTGWRDAKSRAQFLESDRLKSFVQAIEAKLVRRDCLVRLIHQRAPVVVGDSFRGRPSPSICEILTMYFPANLSDAALEALDSITPEIFSRMTFQPIKNQVKSPK